MLGVKTNQFTESKDVYLSIRVMVRVMVRVRVRFTINRLPESEDGKIYLGEVGECND